MKRPFDATTQRGSLGSGERASKRVLLILNGEDSIAVTLPERPQITIGRGSDVDVRIDEPSLSRRHARLSFDAHVTIEDLGSSNGTFVAGTRLVPSQPVLVGPGTTIQLGHVLAVVHVGKTASPTLRTSDGTLEGTRALERAVHRIATTHLSVLVIGETGVGKEVLARKLHDLSPRAAGPFVVVAAAALSAALAEGRLDEARGGTLVLDEIGAVGRREQSDLVRAIDLLGDDVRIIATSRASFVDVPEEARLLPELEHRISGVTIAIPPLRARVHEISAHALRIASEAARALGRPEPVFAPNAIAALERHKWPGNLRELAGRIERAIALAPGRVLTAEHFEFAPPDTSTIGAPLVLSSDPSGPIGALRGARESAEYERILEALRRTNGNQSQAAKLLGISRGTLLSRLDRYHIPRPRRS